LVIEATVTVIPTIRVSLLAGNFLPRSRRSVPGSPAISWRWQLFNPPVADPSPTGTGNFKRLEQGIIRRFRSGTGKEQAGETRALDGARPGCKATPAFATPARERGRKRAIGRGRHGNRDFVSGMASQREAAQFRRPDRLSTGRRPKSLATRLRRPDHGALSAFQTKPRCPVEHPQALRLRRRFCSAIGAP
jgi:hypothetical protein